MGVGDYEITIKDINEIQSTIELIKQTLEQDKLQIKNDRSQETQNILEKVKENITINDLTYLNSFNAKFKKIKFWQNQDGDETAIGLEWDFMDGLEIWLGLQNNEEKFQLYIMIRNKKSSEEFNQIFNNDNLIKMFNELNYIDETRKRSRRTKYFIINELNKDQIYNYFKTELIKLKIVIETILSY